MSSPTRGQVETQWVNAATLLEQSRLYGQANANNWVGMQDTYELSYHGDFVSEQASSVAKARAFLAGLLSNQNAAAMMTPLLKSYVRHVVNAEDITDAQQMLNRIYRYMVDQAFTVKSRNFTFGSPAAGGGNVGNGTILRLNTDEWGFSIENQHVDAKTARCTADQNLGTAIGEESFDFYGQAPGPDGLQVSGSGAQGRRQITGLSCRQSLLSNPSFDQFSGTAATPTAITSWTPSAGIANFAFDGVNYYRTFQGTTPYALQINATTTLTQALSLFNTKLNAGVPYLLQVAWNRQVGAASGTLQANIGTQSNSVAVAAQTGWQLLIAPTVIGTNCWPKNFNQQNLTITLSWTRTGGNLLIDDVLLVPGTPMDGSWYWVIGGSTAFLRNDIFTWTDTATEPGILNRWLWRAFGRYLPSTTGAPTWSNS